MIECRDVKKIVSGVSILNGVTFSAEKGQLLGILGPNGAGKTTTMRILSTYIKPTSGSVVVAGFDAIDNPDQIRARIGVLPESPPLYDELKVPHYIRLMGSLRGLLDQDLETAVEESIAVCRLGSVRNSFCGNLSKGYRQKVGLAAAIIGNPEVLFLDEPTSGLDPLEIIEIRNLIKELKKDRTILFSSHILSEVSEICDKVVFFVRGKTVMEGDVAELTRENSLEAVFLEALQG